MVRVKFMRDGSIAIIEDGVIELFTKTGTYSGRSNEPLTKYMDGVSNLPIISLLSSERRLNIGYYDGASFNIKDTNKSLTDVMPSLARCGGFVRMLQKTDKVGDISYQQVFFLYPEGTDLTNYLEKVE